MNEMLSKGFIPPVCPDVLVDVKEAYSSVYIFVYVCVCVYGCICMYVDGQSESTRMQLCV